MSAKTHQTELTAPDSAEPESHGERGGELEARTRQRVAIIVCAAGLSRRMGEPKLLLPLGNRPILGHVLHQARQSGAKPIIAVVSPNVYDAIEGGRLGDDVVLDDPHHPIQVVVNNDPARGMSSSVKLGVQALPANVHAAMIALGDQPLVPARLFQQLAIAFEQSRALIIAPSYGGRQGHPVLFARELFPELAEVEGDQGGRDVVARYKQWLMLIPQSDARANEDVDTPADLERVRALRHIHPDR